VCYPQSTEETRCGESLPSLRAGNLKILRTIGGVTMRSRNLTWLRLLGTSTVVLGLRLLAGTVLAQEVVTVQLDPVGESGGAEPARFQVDT
jgi:hypothetical protein